MAAEAFAEVVGTPYKVWAGPVGTPFPKVDTLEAAFNVSWKLFGTNGIDNQADGGVTINLAETVASFKPAGGTLKVKDVRTDEDPTVQFGVVDTTVEQLSLILDDAAITTVAAGTGTGGEKHISVIRGVVVKYHALLVRGLSPYDDGSGLIAQWEFSRVGQSGSQALKYALGSWAQVDCEFSIRGDVSGNDPGVYRAQTSPHT